MLSNKWTFSLTSLVVLIEEGFQIATGRDRSGESC